MEGKMSKYDEIMDNPEAYAWDIAEHSNAQEPLGQLVALYHDYKQDYNERIDEILWRLRQITEDYANHEQEKSNEQN